MARVWATDLPPYQKYVLLALADYANDRGGSVFPRQAVLAAKTSLSERTVRRALSELTDPRLGYLVAAGRVHGHDGRGPKAYRIVLENLPTRDRPEADVRPDTVADRPERPTGQSVQADRPTWPRRPDTVADRTTKNHQGTTNTSKNIVRRAPASYSAEFDDFWAAYPRKTAKRTAWSAWGRALTRADAVTICLGAKRYAEDPHRDPEFTKHPASWLNGDCWEDDPLPKRNGPIRHHDRAAEILKEAQRHAALGR